MQRIRGEDTEIIIVAGGDIQSTLTDIRSAEFETMLELKREEYLNESTERKDEIFKGTKFNMELHLETADFLGFQNRIIDRAQRRDPGLQVNIKTTLRFPNGDRPRVIIKDCFFGPIPTKIPARAEYVQLTLEGESSNRATVI